MRRLQGMFVFTAVVTAALATAAEPSKNSVAWQSSLQEAHRLSVEQNKPMMLVFGAPWCHYCKKLETTTLADPSLVRYVNQNFIAVHVDVDDQPRVAKILEVESLPCTVILSPEADLLGRFQGFKQPAPFYSELSKARRAHRNSQDSHRPNRKFRRLLDPSRRPGQMPATYPLRTMRPMCKARHSWISRGLPCRAT